MLWINDKAKWDRLSLVERLEALRLHYCTGPCGQSMSVMMTRSATDKALKDAINELEIIKGNRQYPDGSQF
jgi:hypothetical protein